MGLALAVDLGVEHLVLNVDGGLRLEVDVCAGGFDDLIVLARSRRCRDLQRPRVGRFRGGRDPQAGPFGCLRGRLNGLDDLGGCFGQYQHELPLVLVREHFPAFV